MTIRDWPVDQRPREKPLAQCAQALADAELLTVLLRNGTRGCATWNTRCFVVSTSTYVDRIFICRLLKPPVSGFYRVRARHVSPSTADCDDR